jgi:hypothetical protein
MFDKDFSLVKGNLCGYLNQNVFTVPFHFTVFMYFTSSDTFLVLNFH